MSSTRAARSCTAAIAACSWYSPTAPLATAPSTSATPFRDQRLVPPGPVLFVQRDQLAVGVGTGRPAGVGEHHERGRYEFESVRPGNYSGTPHLHVVIRAPDGRGLETEVEFADDPGAGASGGPVLHLAERGGRLRASLDLVLG